MFEKREGKGPRTQWVTDWHRRMLDQSWVMNCFVDVATPDVAQVQESCKKVAKFLKRKTKKKLPSTFTVLPLRV